LETLKWARKLLLHLATFFTRVDKPYKFQLKENVRMSSKIVGLKWDKKYT
jgi:hypothetical protein